LYQKASGDGKAINRKIFIPDEKWHLYAEFKMVKVRWKIQLVWMFGCIGIFVLMLACIIL